MINYIYICFFISFPYYIFNSGMPQISSIIFFVGSIFILNRYWKHLFRDVVLNPELFYFLAVVLFVNLFWMNYYMDLSFFLTSLYYIYNIGIFYITKRMIEEKELTYENLMFSIVLSFMILLVLGFFIFNIDITSRMKLFFNNPNQLAYFTLLLSSIYSVIICENKENKFNNIAISFIIYIFSFVIIFLTSSLTALVSFFILITIVFFKKFAIKYNKKYIFISTCIFILIIFLSKPFLENKNYMLSKRIATIPTKIEYIYTKRGYDRIINNNEYLLYGAGEGRYDRFNSKLGGELHSLFGNIFFSYGILGLIFFFLFIYKTEKVLNIIMYMLPVFIYSLTHNTIRNPLLWILLAVIIAISSKNKKII